MINKKKKPTVYIESTIPSYLTARPSRNIENYYRQVKTQEWWSKILPFVDPHISVYVLQEIRKGNREASERRIEAIKGFNYLQENETITSFAKLLIRKLKIPEKAKLDGYHLATAIIYKIDYVLSWNFEHIVGAPIRRSLVDIGDQYEIAMPTLCTPEELMEI